MILFDSNEITLPVFDHELIREWIVRVAESYGKEVGRIAYLFCDDDYILEANRQYIGHDYYTDVITFDYSHDNHISGDILLSVDTVRTNAEKFGESNNRELLRVIIHGVLHLCGLKDKEPGEREKMEAAENKALDMIDVNAVFAQ